MLRAVSTAAVCIALLGLTTFATAAPSINSLSGDVRDGSQVTIAGSGFGTKSRARPLVWTNFEDGQVSPLSTQQNLDLRGSISTALTRTGSSRSLRFDLSSTSGAGGLHTQFNSDRLYVSMKRRYAFSIADSSTWGDIGFNLKVLRLWSDMGSNNIHFNYQGKEGIGSGRVAAELTNTGTLWTGGSVPYQANTWTHEEWVYQVSSLNTENGVFDFYRNGKLMWNKRFQNRTNSYPDRYRLLYFDQVSNGTGPGPYYVYYDDIYVDESWHRIVLSDASSWSNASRRELQIPVAWSNGSITFQVNLGDFTASQASNLYLYVVDGEGNANSSGFRVSCTSNCGDGGAPGVVAPSAPVLSVQ